MQITTAVIVVFINEIFAELVERVKKLQKTPLGVKKLANSELFDSFFDLIDAFFILFSTVPEFYKGLKSQIGKKHVKTQF